MSEVLENKSAKKSAVASKEVKAKKVNNAKTKEVNPEKNKEVGNASNKSQNVVKAKTEKTSNNKSTVNKTNTNKISSNKSSSSTTSANKKKQTSNGNSETKSGNSKLKNVDGKSKTELKEPIKNEPKESLKTSEKTKTTKKVTTSKESSEKVVSKKESSKKETPKKQSLQNDSNSKKEEVKTETNNLPAPESKFDTVSLKEIREALQNKVNDNQKQKVVKKVLINIGFAMAMIVYLIVVALATKNIELSVLEKDLKHLKNVHVSAIEEDGKITFLHKVKTGSVDKSYGIHVASLAKLPSSLISRADDILSVYEKKSRKKETFTQTSLFEYAEGDFEIKVNPIEEKIRSINPLEMTPMEALSFLYELNKEVKDKK